MSACLKHEPFELQPACVVLRFRRPAPADDGSDFAPAKMPNSPPSAPPYREDPERLKRAAQAFLLRLGS